MSLYPWLECQPRHHPVCRLVHTPVLTPLPDFLVAEEEDGDGRSPEPRFPLSDPKDDKSEGLVNHYRQNKTYGSAADCVCLLRIACCVCVSRTTCHLPSLRRNREARFIVNTFKSLSTHFLLDNEGNNRHSVKRPVSALQLPEQQEVGREGNEREVGETAGSGTRQSIHWNQFQSNKCSDQGREGKQRTEQRNR